VGQDNRLSSADLKAGFVDGVRAAGVDVVDVGLVTTPILRVDTGDAELDEEFRKKEYLFVLIGYRTSKLHPIQR